ncbi:MAG: hypothetical protein LBQ88_16740 [Treponema sp.]|jgi:hypothetical protein|nr:hypothetical protein [Treponema sp.]
MIHWIDKPISELSQKELEGERVKLEKYRKWYETEGCRYFASLDKVSLDPVLGVNEMLNFKYLQAVYSLNTFFGCHLEPEAYFETGNEIVCAQVIEKEGDIVDMYRAGADAWYCALLSDPFTDKNLLLKTVEVHIPF